MRAALRLGVATEPNAVLRARNVHRCPGEIQAGVDQALSEHGAPAQLLNSWIDRAFSLVTSTRSITEFEPVIHRPRVRPLSSATAIP
jgi:hypothetical protein